MKKLVLGIATAALATLALNTSSTPTAQAQAYGPAGCGLGAMIIGNKPGIIQIFAATTNGIFANQTFGISSGTLGCGAAAVQGISVTKAYVETNRQAFAKDVARGQGETINHISEMAGCNNSAAVGAKLQANFTAVFPTAAASDTQVSSSTITLLKSDPSLRCNKLI